MWWGSLERCPKGMGGYLGGGQLPATEFPAHHTTAARHRPSIHLPLASCMDSFLALLCWPSHGRPGTVQWWVDELVGRCKEEAGPIVIDKQPQTRSNDGPQRDLQPIRHWITRTLETAEDHEHPRASTGRPLHRAWQWHGI